jgi:hypothetical protein
VAVSETKTGTVQLVCEKSKVQVGAVSSEKGSRGTNTRIDAHVCALVIFGSRSMANEVARAKETWPISNFCAASLENVFTSWHQVTCTRAKPGVLNILISGSTVTLY